MLREFLDALSPVSSNPRLMPLGDNGKNPIIKGECRLNTDEAKSFLVSGEEAVQSIRKEGANGFFIYAGKPDHGTEGLVFADRDEPSRWPFIDNTLKVQSGSGEGDHEAYINAGDVQNSEGKGEMGESGGVRAHNWGVVVPGSIHPSGGIYHIVSNPGLSKLHPDDLPRELRPESPSEGPDGGTTRTEERVDITNLPEDFDPNSVTNELGIPLQSIRKASSRLDQRLTHLGIGDYPSLSEEDQGTVRLLLYWRFDEVDIAKILKACRNRKKMQRDGYVQQTITKTIIDSRVDKRLMESLVRAAVNNQGRPPVGPEPLQEARDALLAAGGKATTTTLVESGHIKWGDIKISSVRRRLNRSLNLLAEAEYVSKTTERGRNMWVTDGLNSLTLPLDSA